MRMAGRNLLPDETLPAEYWVMEMTLGNTLNGRDREENGKIMILTRIEQNCGEPRMFTWKAKEETADEDAWIFRTEAEAEEATDAWHRSCYVAHRDRVFTTAEALEYLGITHPTFMQMIRAAGIRGVGSGKGSEKMYRGKDLAAMKRAREERRSGRK